MIHVATQNITESKLLWVPISTFIAIPNLFKQCGLLFFNWPINRINIQEHEILRTRDSKCSLKTDYSLL